MGVKHIPLCVAHDQTFVASGEHYFREWHACRQRIAFPNCLGPIPVTNEWEEVFGKEAITEDLFMAWHYAQYIDAVVQAGKKEYPLPMFVNAALIRPNYPPGRYNSGGPLPHSFDIWKGGGPHIDFFAPDIYFIDNS